MRCVVYMLIWLFARPIQGAMLARWAVHRTIENLREANKRVDH